MPGSVVGARAAGRPLDTAPWGAHLTTSDHHAVPQVFFCGPEAAAVGLFAEQAERAGHRVRAALPWPRLTARHRRMMPGCERCSGDSIIRKKRSFPCWDPAQNDGSRPRGIGVRDGKG
jgi:pyruvate/2-oxoglutarate dehydrogenase complex dihydrolipoamide dehydrogenase (E3) component